MKLSGLQNIVLDHCSRYPELQVEDLYKLTHQAALGSEHAVKNIESARQWLLSELDQLPVTSEETLIDVISPDRSIVRIHLKPYIESDGDREDLLQAFIQTANYFSGSTDLLREYWWDIEGLVKEVEIPLQIESLKSFFERMEAHAFPAVHHSAQYKQSYQPSYRIIANEYLDMCIGNLDSYSS